MGTFQAVLLLCVGGTFLESSPGEKLEMIRPYYHKYLEQIHG